MKRIHLVFLLLVLLVSCSNFPSLIPINTPQPTFTSTLTFTPSVTPTITLTPTETPDPNMPPDATGKDSVTGEYTKSVDENGKVVVYVWKQFQFGDDSKNGVTGHWFKSWMANGPINLIGYGENCSGVWDIWKTPISAINLNMNVYAIENQTYLDRIGNLFHPDRAAEWEKGNFSCGSLSLPFLITQDLFLRYINLLPSDNPRESFGEENERLNAYYYNGATRTPDELQHWINDHESFLKALTDGSFSIKIENNDWIPKNGYEVYWVNEEMVMNDPTFQVNISSSVVKSYYLKVTAIDGKLIAFIAPGKGWLKGQLIRERDKREWIFRTMILFPLEAAIKSTYPIYNASLLPYQEYQSKTGVISGTIDGKPFYINTPFIDFTDS